MKTFIYQGVKNPAEILSVDLVEISSTSSGISAINIALNDTNTGTVPKLIASLFLLAKAYTVLKACIGCYAASSTATLVLKEADGSVVSTLTKTGTVDWVSNDGFTLSVDSNIDVYLYADTATAIAVAKGVFLS